MSLFCIFTAEPTDYPPTEKKAPKVAKYGQNGNFEKCRSCAKRFGAVWVKWHKKKTLAPIYLKIKWLCIEVKEN